MKKKFLYLFPSNYGHSGINVKVDGQLQTLRHYFSTTLLHIRYQRSDSFIKKAIAAISFELRACINCFSQDIIYLRYNPKTPLITLFLRWVSRYKPVYIEHNTLLANELRYLKRPIENKVHHFLIKRLKKSRIIHIAVNQELQEHLINLGLQRKYVKYHQNGYKRPELNTKEIDSALVEEVRQFKKLNHKLAIFTGNGYRWHGIEEILDLTQSEGNLQVLVVGPYPDIKSSDRISCLGKLSPHTLSKLYELCDFAISTFRWDLIGITEGSPLKTREYLCHGLPIWVNYHDCACDYPELKDYVFDYRLDKDSLSKITKLSPDKKKIALTAKQNLSWDTVWAGLWDAHLIK